MSEIKLTVQYKDYDFEGLLEELAKNLYTLRKIMYIKEETRHGTMVKTVNLEFLRLIRSKLDNLKLDDEDILKYLNDLVIKNSNIKELLKKEFNYAGGICTIGTFIAEMWQKIDKNPATPAPATPAPATPAPATPAPPPPPPPPPPATPAPPPPPAAPKSVNSNTAYDNYFITIKNLYSYAVHFNNLSDDAAITSFTDNYKQNILEFFDIVFDNVDDDIKKLSKGVIPADYDAQCTYAAILNYMRDEIIKDTTFNKDTMQKLFELIFSILELDIKNTIPSVLKLEDGHYKFNTYCAKKVSGGSGDIYVEVNKYKYLSDIIKRPRNDPLSGEKYKPDMYFDNLFLNTAENEDGALWTASDEDINKMVYSTIRNYDNMGDSDTKSSKVQKLLNMFTTEDDKNEEYTARKDFSKYSKDGSNVDEVLYKCIMNNDISKMKECFKSLGNSGSMMVADKFAKLKPETQLALARKFGIRRNIGYNSVNQSIYQFETIESWKSHHAELLKEDPTNAPHNKEIKDLINFVEALINNLNIIQSDVVDATNAVFENKRQKANAQTNVIDNKIMYRPIGKIINYGAYPMGNSMSPYYARFVPLTIKNTSQVGGGLPHNANHGSLLFRKLYEAIKLQLSARNKKISSADDKAIIEAIERLARYEKEIAKIIIQLYQYNLTTEGRDGQYKQIDIDKIDEANRTLQIRGAKSEDIANRLTAAFAQFGSIFSEIVNNNRL